MKHVQIVYDAYFRSKLWLKSSFKTSSVEKCFELQNQRKSDQFAKSKLGSYVPS
jgi:hypothetical protein